MTGNMKGERNPEPRTVFPQLRGIGAMGFCFAEPRASGPRFLKAGQWDSRPQVTCGYRLHHSRQDQRLSRQSSGCWWGTESSESPSGRGQWISRFLCMDQWFEIQPDSTQSLYTLYHFMSKNLDINLKWLLLIFYQSSKNGSQTKNWVVKKKANTITCKLEIIGWETLYKSTTNTEVTYNNIKKKESG